MPFFDYRVKTSDGSVQKGKVEAASINRAAETLQEKGYFIINIEPAATGGLRALGQKQGKMNFKETVMFTRQLAAIVEAGLTLTTGISILVQQATPESKVLLSQILNDLQSGLSFSQALEKHPNVFDRSYVYLVQAGESSGSLEVVLNRLADNMESQRAMKGKISGAMIYPAIVLVVMVAVVAIMMTVVIPKIASIFDEFDAELPMITQILINTSNFTVQYWWVVLLGIAVTVAFFWVWYQGPAAKRLVERISFKVPIYGDLRRKTLLTSYTQTLAMLVKSGVPLVDSLQLSADSVSSLVYRDELRDVQDKVEKGVSLGQAIEGYSDDFPLIMSQMIKIGEETGKMDDILSRLTRFFSDEATQAIDNLMAAMEPIIMVILGIVVAFLVVAIILPVYQLTDTVGV